MLKGTWHLHYDRGLGSLARHHPADAVKSLKSALEGCPPSRTRDLYQICLFLGVALRRMGFPQSAIKSWVSCQRLNKRGPARKMLSRYTNSYGMERQDSSDADDWQAFSSIQIARYLIAKNKRAFSTQAEHDMIVDLVRDSWTDLKASNDLSRLSSCEKIKAFRASRIVFPSIFPADRRSEGDVIAVNFQTKQRVGLEDRCSCGSGMPFMLCCGRTPGRDELLSGSF
jgi:hypothetical protein